MLTYTRASPSTTQDTTRQLRVELEQYVVETHPTLSQRLQHQQQGQGGSPSQSAHALPPWQAPPHLQSSLSSEGGDLFAMDRDGFDDRASSRSRPVSAASVGFRPSSSTPSVSVGCCVCMLDHTARYLCTLTSAKSVFDHELASSSDYGADGEQRNTHTSPDQLMHMSPSQRNAVSALHKASWLGRRSRIFALLRQGEDINQVGCPQGAVGIVHRPELLSLTRSPTHVPFLQIDAGGRTPLMYAARGKHSVHVEIAQDLLKRGADVDIQAEGEY